MAGSGTTARLMRRLLDTEPMVFVSLVVGTTGVAMVLVAPRVRHALGYPTEQYYGLEDPDTGAPRQPEGPRPKWTKEPGEKPKLV
jgi:hypothetical protein